MFLRSLISIDEVLEESDLFRLLKNFGVDLVNSSPKSFSFDTSGFSTYVTSNKYTIRYQGEKFALSYSTVEDTVTESREGALGSFKTYVCVLTSDTSLDLLQKLAYYFDTTIDTYDIRDRDSYVPNQFIRNLLPF